MNFDNIKTNYIIPAEAEIDSVRMGLYSQSKNPDKHIGTFGLGPCTAIAASVITDSGDVYAFCSHIDMGEIWGYSIPEHVKLFDKFLSQVNDFKSIEVKLVSSQSFLNVDYLGEKETKLLSMLQESSKKYGFEITHSKSSVVQIDPDGRIKTPSKKEIDENKMRQAREVARANGYSFDYSTKTPCIVDKNLGCFLFNCDPVLQLKLKNSNPDDYSRLLQEKLQDRFWKSLVEAGGVVLIGDSPLNPGEKAYFLNNFKEVAEGNYGYIMNAMQIDDPPTAAKHGLFDTDQYDLLIE